MKRQKPDEKQPGTPTSNASLQVRQPCIRDHTTTCPYKLLAQRESGEQKNKGAYLFCVYVCVCECECLGAVECEPDSS